MDERKQDDVPRSEEDKVVSATDAPPPSIEATRDRLLWPPHNGLNFNYMNAPGLNGLGGGAPAGQYGPMPGQYMHMGMMGYPPLFPQQPVGAPLPPANNGAAPGYPLNYLTAMRSELPPAYNPYAANGYMPNMCYQPPAPPPAIQYIMVPAPLPSTVEPKPAITPWLTAKVDEHVAHAPVAPVVDNHPKTSSSRSQFGMLDPTNAFVTSAGELLIPHDILTEPRINGRVEHRCPYVSCTYTSFKSTNLVAHIRLHTGEKPYRCSFPDCNYSSSQLSNIKVHERLHYGIRPYKCDFPGCHYAANQNSNLKAHKKRTHRGGASGGGTSEGKKKEKAIVEENADVESAEAICMLAPASRETSSDLDLNQSITGEEVVEEGKASDTTI